MSIFAQHSYAQKTAAAEAAKNDTPQKAANTSVIGQYLSFSGLGMLEMQRMFRSLSPESRAAVMKFHIAFQLVKRPGLTAEQKALLLDGLSMLTADSYSDTDTAKQAAAEQTAILLDSRAKALFQGRERFEIFANLGPTKDDIFMLQKYEDLTPLNDLQRKEVFRESTAEEKRDLWRVHIALYLAGHLI
jgi:hypothetical protein